MDSDNILSILAALGQAPMAPQPVPEQGITPVSYQPLPDQAPISNVLQAVAAPPAAPIASQAVPIAQPAAPVTAPTPDEPPRKRRSVIETIGRLADVFAKVGGAEALYEPTLNARDDRGRQIDMEALKKQLIQHQVRAGGMEVEATERKRLGTALGALVGRENAAGLWPSIAEQAGIDPQKTAVIGQILQANPDAAGIFARGLGADIDNLGKNVYFGTDPKGKTVAYQVGEDGRPHILDFGGELAPSDPTKVVNLGGTTAVLGSGGNIKRILPNTEAPGRAADRQSRITIAGMRPSAAGKAADGSNDVANILNDFGIKLSGPKDPVADLIKGSTSGYVENLASMVPGAMGKATPGQRNIGRLETIDNALVLALAGGKLGSGVSNADRDFFKEMSGKISDPNTPADKRLAAWDSIKNRLRGIQERSAKPAAVKPKANSGGWSIVEVK